MTSPVLQLEGSLDPATIPRDVATELRCYLKVHAAAAIGPATRSIVANLCLVLDCSGSMVGDKAEAAVEAAKRIVDIVDERHRISLVGFALSSRVIVDNAQATAAGRDAIKREVDRLRQMFGGGTILGSGIRAGADQVQRFAADARILVILSDGAADDRAEALDQALRARELGIQLFAVGIGDDYEADHLRKLVAPSSGAVLAPSHVNQLAATFGELVARIENFVATNAQLVVALGDRVRARHLYRTLPQPAFIGDVSLARPAATPGVDIRVGNVERDQTHAFLLAMVVSPSPHGDPDLEVARATLTFDVPALGLRGQRQDIALRVARGGDTGAGDAEISGVYRSAQIARLVDELVDAQRRGAKDECLDRIDLLLRIADEQADDRARASYEQLRDAVAGDRAISQKALNELVIASTAPRPAGDAAGAIKPLYDVVLVAPGDAPILLLRALRDATGKSLSQLNALIAMAPVAIQEALPRRDADALVARIDGSGAGAMLRVRKR
jgi:ribosomal protein L7/L12/uncharacterized protein YegL